MRKGDFMENLKDNPVYNEQPDGGYTCIFRKIGVIGDSLASGEHESKDENGVVGYHDYYEYSWGQFLARKCGTTVVNYSVGGLTAQRFHPLSTAWKTFDPENACQAYIIALGVNDTKRCEEGLFPFGDISDVDWEDCEKNKDTLIGNYVKIIQRARMCEPKCRIFVVTPPRSDDPARDARHDRLNEFLRTLPSLFEFLYVIDLNKYAPVYDKKFREFYHLGGHLSAIGYKYTADIIANYIDYIIKHNVDDFKQVGFIGKKFHRVDTKW